MQGLLSRVARRAVVSGKAAGRRMLSSSAVASETNLKRLDLAVSVLGTVGVAWGCAELYNLYTDFPEGCQVRKSLCSRNIFTHFFGPFRRSWSTATAHRSFLKYLVEQLRAHLVS